MRQVGGAKIGIQTSPEWAPGSTDPSQTLLTADVPFDGVGVLEIDVQGRNVELAVTYGTASSATVAGLRPPLKVAVIGTVQIDCKPIDRSARAYARVAVASVLSAGPTRAVSIQTTAGPAPESAIRATAITAGVSLLIDGNVVPLALGASVDVAFPTVLTAGEVIWEHVL